eukprot:581407-Amphidinium_carterae.1
MPLPFPVPAARAIRVWPSSPRRIGRILRRQGRQRWVNHIVTYLGWMAVGKPGGAPADDVRFFASSLPPLQMSMCDRLWNNMDALIRPGRTVCPPGRGRVSDLLEGLAMDPGPYGSIMTGTDTHTLDASNMALPATAAVVELVPPLVQPELSTLLHTPGGLDLPLDEHPQRLPAMYMQVNDWPAVARRLLDSGLAHVVDYEAATRSHGRSLSSGLFGVSKPGSDLKRVIVDRRRKNACERSLREATLLASAEQQWDLDRTLSLGREMTLPHPLQFKDLFMVHNSRLRIDTKDAKDYFYLMSLPEAQRHATPIGWPLRRRELGLTDPHDAGESLVILCLTAPAMGSKHSMEIAQATHHGVMRMAGILKEDLSWITLGWPPPASAHWMGCYCDDLALISVCPEYSACSATEFPSLLSDAAEQGMQNDVAAKEGCKTANFVVKREKCESDQKEAVVWGSELSSARKDVGCPVNKVANIAHVTWLLMRRPFVTTKHLEILLGLWGHVLLHCRIGMCFISHGYRWLRQLTERKSRGGLWDIPTRDELAGLALCWPLFRTSLLACLSPTVIATDATLRKAGGVECQVSPKQAVALWGRQRWHRVGLTFQGVDGDLDHPLFSTSVPLHRDCALELGLQTLQFRETFRYRFRDKRHINFQELLAWRTGITSLSRRICLHETKILSLLGSQVVCYSIRKGRSTSHALNGLLQSVAGTCLLGKLDVVPLWISSAANAADDPTRIDEVRCAEPATPESDAFWATACRWTWPLQATAWEWRRREFIDDMEFNACLGYPGEGPGVARRRELAAHASVAVPDLRISVQPITAARYGARIRQLRLRMTCCWGFSRLSSKMIRHVAFCCRVVWLACSQSSAFSWLGLSVDKAGSLLHLYEVVALL